MMPLLQTLEVDLSRDDEEKEEEENTLGLQAYVFLSLLGEGGVPGLHHLKLVSTVLANANSSRSLRGLTSLELNPGDLGINSRRGGHLPSLEALLELLSYSHG